MDKLKELIAEAKGINTNDLVFQRRIVAVLEEMLKVIEVKQMVSSRCSCEPLD